MHVGNVSWARHIWRRLFGHWQEYKAVPAAPAEMAASSSSTAGAYGFYDDGSFRVLYVGKDAAGSVLRHSYGDSSRSDNVFASMFDIDMPAPEDAVPYLDDSNEEQMAAHIARRQSLLRRSLRRVRFVRPQHAVRTAPVL